MVKGDIQQPMWGIATTTMVTTQTITQTVIKIGDHTTPDQEPNNMHRFYFVIYVFQIIQPNIILQRRSNIEGRSYNTQNDYNSYYRTPNNFPFFILSGGTFY